MTSSSNELPAWAFFFMYEGNPTGGPKRSLDTAIAAQKNGLAPILITNQESPIVEKAESLGIGTVILSIPETLRSNQGKAISLNPRHMIRIQRDLNSVSSQIETALLKHNICGLWARGIKTVLMARKSAKRTRIPLIWDIGAEYKSRGLVAGIHLLGFLASKKVVAQGDSVLRQTFSDHMLRMFRNKIQAITPGLDQSRVSSLKQHFDSYDKDDPISIIGTINSRKNQLAAITACNLLLEKNINVRLRIVGNATDPSYLERCKELTNRFKENYEWYGWTEDVSSVLANSSALLMASKQEGLPQVVLEAMHAGRPVISVPVGGVPDLLVDGANGFLTNSFDPEDIAKAIEAFVNTTKENASLIRCHARDTVERVANHETWESNYAAMLKSVAQ